MFAKKGLSNDDAGVARGAAYFRRYGRELVSKPAISFKRSVGWATVVRAHCLFLARVVIILLHGLVLR